MDSGLIAELYQKYGRELKLYIYSLCKNMEDTEDMLQEVWVKAMLSLPPDVTNIRAWLYTVARNEFNNRWKHGKHGEKVMDELKHQYQDTEPPDRELVQEERNELLHRAIDQLDGRLKEIIVMQYYEGLPQKEIAAILGVSPENVRVMAHRAKLKLKEYMEKYDG